MNAKNATLQISRATVRTTVKAGAPTPNSVYVCPTTGCG